ncbi:hypothetical protein BX600DRAFT_207038 [Xylariales sp. PMI_506]|nr:hypothetical protein BX600DRAFT_207038 [Xylariales sp. PMI_506]
MYDTTREMPYTSKPTSSASRDFPGVAEWISANGRQRRSGSPCIKRTYRHQWSKTLLLSFSTSGLRTMRYHEDWDVVISKRCGDVTSGRTASGSCSSQQDVRKRDNTWFTCDDWLYARHKLDWCGLHFDTPYEYATEMIVGTQLELITPWLRAMFSGIVMIR